MRTRSAAMATDSALVNWLKEPSSERGIRFKVTREGWDEWSYQKLAALTISLADGLVRAGARRNDVVLVAVPSGPAFVASLFGAQRAGAVPCPVSLPFMFRDRQRYDTHMAGVLAAAEPGLVVVDDSTIASMRQLI